MALSIPVEIWLLIASYVGKEDYDKLINVNRVFFNIIMDKRYRKVLILYINKPHTRRKLVRLCDPVVASRVRSLYVHANFDPDNDLHSHAEEKRDYWGFFKRLKFLRKDSGSCACFTQSLLQSFLAVVKCMSNLTEFIVDWPCPIPTELKPFLPTVWKSFGPNLRSLTLGSIIPSVNKFVLSTPASRFVALEELCLKFCFDGYCSLWKSTRSMDATNMERRVAPFINKLAPQLRHLSIFSLSLKLDLCPLFSALVPSFPALRHFSIRAPFPSTYSSNPHALANFLRCNAKTIRDVDLVLIGHGYYFVGHDGFLASWLEELSADPVVLSGLHSLRIYPTYSSQAGFNAMVSLTRRSAETLTSLSVIVRYLTHEEVTTIVSIFSANRSSDSCNLVTLRLKLRRLDPPLIRLFATNLTRLQMLSLCVWRESIEITASNMQGHFYPNWRLHDLGIWYDRSEVNESVLRLVAQAVPSIKSFWGDGCFVTQLYSWQYHHPYRFACS